MALFVEKVTTGDIFKDCTVFDENEFYWFLHGDNPNIYYDIVMPKEDARGKAIKVGTKLHVKVVTIHIADDGVPGAFVAPL